MKTGMGIVVGLCVVLGIASAYGQWIQTSGPGGGGFYSVTAGDSVVLAGSAGAGLFLSSDTGTTWFPISSGYVNTNVYAAGMLDSCIFAGTTNFGFWRTTDCGKSWQRPNNGTSYISSISVIGSAVWIGSDAGVMVSTNDGVSWLLKNTGFTYGNTSGIVSLGGYLLASTAGGGVFRSSNGGTGWALSSGGLSTYSALDVFGLVVRGTKIFAATYNGVYLSSDSGASWHVSGTGLSVKSVRSICLSGNDICVGVQGGGVYLSSDSGSTWQSFNSGLADLSINSVASIGGTLFAATQNGGIFRSSDGGAHWVTADYGLATLQVPSLMYNGNNLIAGTGTSGAFISSDMGSHWRGPLQGLERERVLALASIDSMLFAGGPGGVFRSTDNGGSWQRTTSSLSDTMIMSLCAFDTVLYAGTYAHVYRTTDRGGSWNEFDSGMIGGAQSLIRHQGFLFASSVYIYRLSAGATQWEAAGDSGIPFNPGVSAFGSSSQFLYAIFPYTGTGMYVSGDLGTHWSHLSPGTANSILSGLAIAGSTIFVGTSDSGMYASSDAGSHWFTVNDDLQDRNISSLLLHDSVLIAGTSIRGVARRPVREMVPAPGSLFGFTVAAGWNLLSLPLTLTDYTVKDLFPAAASRAFAYNGSYSVRDTLKNCEGYWLNFSGPGTVPIAGMPRLSDSADVKTGWNLIGAISAPVAVADIGSSPGGMTTSKFFSYDGTYSIADTLRPGAGYWVNTSQPGRLIFTAHARSTAAARIRISAGSERPPLPPGSEQRSDARPADFQLDQPYPSPFNPSATIRFTLPVDCLVDLRVCTVLGQTAEIITSGIRNAGSYATVWNAARFASGVYYIRMTAEPLGGRGGKVEMLRKLVHMK